MAVESNFSENLDSRNRGRAEPNKKLKKRRSIRVSRMPSLKPRSKSRFDWPPSDLSSDASSLQQASSIALSDSAPNYMKSTSSFIAKKESPQGGSECDDVNSVVSSSCGSSDRVVHPFISISDDAAMPQHPSSIEVSDASPSYVEAKRWPGGKKGHFQASPCDSESSYDSNDRTKSSHTSESNSVYFSRKSLHNTSRASSSSIRNVRVLVKKASFKPKRNSSKSSQISTDPHVDKATCSSMIKDSRFPEHVELQAGETEAARISFVKVCPYHHCSLNGHSHDPPPKEHSSHERRQSLKPQMSKKPRSVNKPKVKPASGKKEGVKKNQMNSNKEAPIQQGALVQRETVKAFYTEKGIILETRLGSYNMKMDVNESISPDFVAELEGDENTASSVGAREKNLTLYGENINFPRTDSSEMFRTLDNPADTSCESDATLNTQPSKNVPPEMERNSISSNTGEATIDERVISSISDSHTSQDLRLCVEETNRNLKPDVALTAGFTPAGGSEYKLQNPDRNSETPLSLEVPKPHFNKGRHISMWHLIHKHMASGIAAEDTKKPFQGENKEKKVEEAKTDPAKDSSDAYMEPSYSDIDIENQETANQEIEVRKLFAIKLVREAIEKILLPEVQDQSSETQSIASDLVEDQEIPEKNQEAPGEGCHGGNGNSNTGGNTAADPGVLDHTEDSLSGQEEKKLQTKSGKKSDKKSPSNWSNLKRWVLLQRFVKELEKVRKFNPSKPRHLQLETGPESEKVNLRHQTVDERRRAEEWMLDHALRQVVSELAPTQKKKVALLVKAFETVVPPQEDRNIQITLPKLKDESHEDAFIKKKEDLSPTEMKDKKSQTEEKNMGKPDDWERSSVPEGHGTAKGHDMPLDDDTQSSTDPCLKLDSIINSCEEVPGDAESEQEPTANLIGDCEPISISQHIVADTIAKNMEHIAYSTREQQVPGVVNREFPPMDLKIPDKENESCQSQLDRQNYIRMWHMVYQHVASAIATKVGNRLLGGEDEVEDDNYLSERDISGLRVDPANGSCDGVKEDHKASHLQSEFSKINAVKLIQEAVNEILADTSDTESITSETSLNQELSENGNREVEKQSISGSTSLNKENINKFEGEGGFSLDEERGSSPDIGSNQEHKRAVSPDKNEPYPRKMKNWSKLKKLMLLKRSIKAMEKARELKSQSQQLLSVSSDPQPEKIDLRQRMIDERKKAEQWMLDYAVQHIVTKLTPARKRRVAMLVEAFEAVVPLPAV